MTADVVPKSGRRKPSLESKFSISPSSYSATGSEDALRFTRKLSVRRYYRWSFTFLSAFLLILLIAASSVYLGYTYLGHEDGSTEKVFRVSMRILGWDGLKQWLGRRGAEADGKGDGAALGGGVGVVLPPQHDGDGKPEGDGLVHSYRDPVHLIDTPHLLRSASRDLRERVNLIFRRSKVRSAFVGSKVIALHGLGDGDLGFHSELIFDTKWLDNESDQTLNAANVHRILEQELFSLSRVYFANITVDPKSLYVQEEGAPVETTTSAQSREETTMTPEPPRWCEEGKLKYCAVGAGSESLSTLISYPNVFNHKSIAEVMQDLIAFRETVDSECHPLAHSFFCSLLQPPCWEVDQTAEMGEEGYSSEGKGPQLPLPCQSFCEELSSACGDRIPPRLWSKVNCKSYPENGTCIPRPGCVAELSGRSLSHLLCDGLPDCKDRADEMLEQCSSTCSSKQNVYHCDEGEQGSRAKCVEKHRRCDGVEDCGRGGDEKGCVFFKSETSEISGGPAEVKVIHHGEQYSICGDEDVSSVSQNTSNEEIASWVCNKLHQGEVRSLKLSSSSGKHFLRPTAGMSSFVPTSCPSGRTLHLKCHRRECGLQPMLNGLGSSLGDKDATVASTAALPGDWPWEAVLLKDGRHVCDATLVSPHWILTAASCFDGFRPPTLSWMVRLGALRPTGSQHPWLQETSLVGMVTSPTGSLALGRLTNPIMPDNYIGTACLPELAIDSQKGLHVSLSWGTKGDRLEPINLTLVPCVNMSGDASRILCTEEVHSDFKKSCSAMQLPGAPLLQRNIHSDDSQQSLPKWTVVGVETGRTSVNSGMPCGKLEFEAVKGSLDWIRHTIQGISQAGEDSLSSGRR